MTSPKRAVDFQRVFEASQENYVLLAADEPDFTILAASDGYLYMSGMAREELVGRKVFEVFPENPEQPEGAPISEIRSSLKRVMKEKEVHFLRTFRYDLPDPQDEEGTFIERYWSPRNIPVLGPTGEVQYILHRADEVTDFVLRERLRGQHEYTPDLADAPAPLLVVETEPEWRSYLTRLLGTQWQVESVGSGEYAFQEIAENPPALVLVGDQLADMAGDEFVTQLRQRAGSPDVPVILALQEPNPSGLDQAFTAGADDVISGLAPSREILARVQAQLSAAELRQTLKEQANERARQLLMEAPEAIALAEGPEHVFTMSNPAHDEIAGHRPLLGLPVRKAFPEPGLQPFYDQMDAVYGTGVPYRVMETPVEQQVPGTEDTFTRYVNFAYLPVRDLNGDIYGVAVFVNDITWEVEARKEIEREAERKDEFLSMLGHELRNPLSPIVNMAQVLNLKEGEIDPGQLRQISSVLLRQTSHLTRIVDDLLDMSRLKKGKITLHKEIIDLRDLVPQAVEAVPGLQGPTELDFSVSLPEEPLYVHGDPVRLTQVFTNLLDNAIKYTPSTGWVQMKGSRGKDEVVLSVTDNGTGLDPNFIPKLFEPFERGAAEGTQILGLGLGLPLVRHLVELHGGTITGESPGTGMGATFTVRLPTASEPT